jgi:hypothetical protein
MPMKALRRLRRPPFGKRRKVPRREGREGKPNRIMWNARAAISAASGEDFHVGFIGS